MGVNACKYNLGDLVPSALTPRTIVYRGYELALRLPAEHFEHKNSYFKVKSNC